MKETCKFCDGIGLETDQNGVQKDEPCPICDGYGYFEVEQFPDIRDLI